MRFGFSIRIVPGVRVGVSTSRRGRTRVWASEGSGPFWVSQSATVGRRRRRAR